MKAEGVTCLAFFSYFLFFFLLFPVLFYKLLFSFLKCFLSDFFFTCISFSEGRRIFLVLRLLRSLLSFESSILLHAIISSLFEAEVLKRIARPSTFCLAGKAYPFTGSGDQPDSPKEDVSSVEGTTFYFQEKVMNTSLFKYIYKLHIWRLAVVSMA